MDSNLSYIIDIDNLQKPLSKETIKRHREIMKRELKKIELLEKANEYTKGRKLQFNT